MHSSRKCQLTPINVMKFSTSDLCLIDPYGESVDGQLGACSCEVGRDLVWNRKEPWCVIWPGIAWGSVVFCLRTCSCMFVAAMVFFTCAHCGESLKKSKVEKHYQTVCSRNSVAVTCVDCCKDFRYWRLWLYFNSKVSSYLLDSGNEFFWTVPTWIIWE